MDRAVKRSPSIAALIAVAVAAAPAAAQVPPLNADVELLAGPKPAPPAPAPASAAPDADVEALRREMREDRLRLGARIDALEAEIAERRAALTPAPPPAPPATGIGGSLPGHGAWVFGTYLQAQYEQHQSSQDQIGTTGAYLNQDRFLVRRGRLRFEAGWEYLELAAELDGNTTNGPAFGPKRLNASLVWRREPWEGKLPPRGPREAYVPTARLTFGLTAVPFGFELVDSPKDRVFLERTQASQAFFPGEQDVGAVLSGALGPLRYAVAAMNGNPASDSSSLPVGDPNHAKDFLGRLGADVRSGSSLRIDGGVSALYGTGFHAGTSATKGGVTWVDQNQDGTVQPSELVGVPALAAKPSQNFSRWGAGVDLQVSFRTGLGWSMLYGEATLATNLDRGFFVADPVASGADLRERGAYAAFVQEITSYGLLGFRFDYYDPDVDPSQKTGAPRVPASQPVHTFSPVVGVQLPDRARLLFEYDAVRNLLGSGPAGAPANLPMDHFAVRLQVQL
jgi:hypothetical protein